MNEIVSLLQNVYFAWLVVAIAVLFAFVTKKNYDSQIKTMKENHSKEINIFNEKAMMQMQRARAQADELVRQTQEKCNDEIQHERQLYNEKIRLLQEQIESDKASIMKKTEKEILADLTVSLNGFAKRIERVENNLTNVNHEMELIVDKVDNIGITVSDVQFNL